jgi:hypothetical protein
MADPPWTSLAGGNAASVSPWHACLEDLNQQAWYIILYLNIAFV